MPIPFLFIGIGAVAAAIGVGKTVIAGVDQKDANETNKCASSIVESAKKSAKKCQKQSGNAIKDLGNKKIDILNTSIMSFI
ncbi:MAG: hypothetical protein RR355_00850 [Oscillospiraceae bacterium]